MLNQTSNLVLPFQLESSHLRGRLVHLGPALDLILHQHAYPDAVGHLLAEAVAVAVALASALKYDGVFTLQAKGDGPVRMLVADVTSDGGLRAYAQFDKDKLGDLPSDTRLLGKGYLAFTCVLTGQEDRYQGIVALEGGTISEAVQHYFRQSEQIATGIMTAAMRDDQGRWRGGCLLLQRMPRKGGNLLDETGDARPGTPGRSEFDVEATTPEVEDWTRAMMVMGTCTPQELTDAAVPPETLLYRLFHEEGVRIYDALPLRHQCRCSQSRVEGMLRSLPPTEIEELAVGGLVTVTCEFCNKNYVFDGPARRKLYTEPAV